MNCTIHSLQFCMLIYGFMIYLSKLYSILSYFNILFTLLSYAVSDVATGCSSPRCKECQTQHSIHSQLSYTKQWR